MLLALTDKNPIGVSFPFMRGKTMSQGIILILQPLPCGGKKEELLRKSSSLAFPIIDSFST